MHRPSTRVIALVFAVLLVTAPVGSVWAVPGAQPSEAADQQTRIAAERVATLAEDRSSLERKAAATEAVRRIDAGRHDDRKNASIVLLDGSLDHYRDGTRIDSRAALRNDSLALHGLSTLAGGPNDTELDAATLLIYEADEDTVATAIDDANRALDEARNRTEARESSRPDERPDWKRGGPAWRDEDDRSDSRRSGRARGNRGDRGPPWADHRDDRDTSWADDRDDDPRLRAAAVHVRSAERSLERANEFAEGQDRGPKGDGVRSRVRSRAIAVRHLLIAWWHAQRAIDVLDRGSEPEVQILTRTDPPRNGSEAVTREIAGTVHDPRAYELPNATVTVDGNRTFDVPLNATTAPATNATFAFNVTLERRVTTVNVTVEDRDGRTRDGRGRTFDPDDRWGDPEEWRDAEWDDPFTGTDDRGSFAERIRGWIRDRDERDRSARGRNRGARDRGDRDERKGRQRGGRADDSDRDGVDRRDDDQRDRGRWDGPHHDDRETDRSARAEIGHDVLRLDGDGLSDTYETRVVEMDPLDPDSDSGVTDRNEADDGVIDGEETFGSSTLPLGVQDRIGADPFTNDTDDDGLTDEFELTGLGLLFNDVGSSDFDEDGVPDAEEDPDNDTLTNAREQELGTDPLVNDTDEDGLTDDVEVDLGLDPLVADGDEDGLDDGSERRLGTDPANPDTDDDGVLDGNETYTVRKANADVGVALDVTGEGDLTGAVSIEEDDDNVAFQNISSAVSPVVELESTRNFSTASVTISYDESQVKAGNESDVAVYTFNESSGTFARLNSTVDAANDTVTAETTHFSRFVAFDSRAWREQFENASTPSTFTLVEEFEDLDGWSTDGDAGIENGTLVLSGEGGEEGVTNPDLVVAKDGSGDFQRIQPAVNAASDGDTILVEEGVYNEEVVLNSSIRLVGEKAELNGSGLGDETAGIQLVDGTSVEVTGFAISNYTAGVRGEAVSTTVRLERTVVGSNHDGIFARAATGNWTLRSVTVSGNDGDGIDAERAEGDWSISSSDLSKNAEIGIYADEATGHWRLHRVDLSRIGWDGIAAEDSRGEWVLSNVDLSQAGWDGLFVRETHADWTLDSVNLSRASWNGIYAGYHTTGDWTISNVDLSGSGWDGIATSWSRGDWTLTNVDLSGAGWDGLYAGNARGAWSLSNVNVSGSGWDGINARNTNDDWRLSDVDLSGAGFSGVNFGSSSGDWTLERVNISNSTDWGANLAWKSGSVDVREADIRGNGEGGLNVLRTDDVDVTRSRIYDNGGVDVDARSASRPPNATRNWWGQSTGPTSDQVRDNVTTFPHCTSPDCAPSSITVDPLDGGLDLNLDDVGARNGGGGIGGSSTVTRSIALPEDAPNLSLSVRLRGNATSESPALVRVTNGREAVTVAELTSPADAYRTRTADLTRFAGQNVTVEIVAEGDAELQIEDLRITSAVDSDGDGLPDSVETAGIRSGTNKVYQTDPNDPDTDGDGLPDGVEAGERVGDSHYDVLSDPTQTNSDGDDLDDFHEVQIGTDPFDTDTDGDGIIDSGDPDPFNPSSPDPGLTMADGRALVVGAVSGEVGFEGVQTPFGVVGQSEYRDSPYYLAGWVIGSIVPGADIVADLRDLVTNLLAGDPAEAALDAAGLIPVVGKIGDGAKAAKIIAKWLRKFPTKTARAARVVGKYIVSVAPTSSFDEIYSSLGKGDDYRRLVTDGGLSDEAFRKLVKDNLNKINEVEEGANKLDEPLTITDVEDAFTDTTGTVVVLIKTDKWKHIDDVATDGPGFTHIVARHADETASGFEDFAMKPGSKTDVGAHQFPPSMGPEEIKEAIRIAGKNGEVADDGLNIAYSGSALDHLPIDEMTVRRVPDSGNVITAYPST